MTCLFVLNLIDLLNRPMRIPNVTDNFFPRQYQSRNKLHQRSKSKIQMIRFKMLAMRTEIKVDWNRRKGARNVAFPRKCHQIDDE